MISKIFILCNILLYFIMFFGFPSLVYCKMEEFIIDVNDILNENLMPAAFFMIEGPNGGGNRSDEQINNRNTTGTLNVAISTMEFHRKMIKQYMCSNYLAGAILNDINPTRLERRMDLATNDTNRKSRQIKRDIQEAMRFDQGSSGYKDWLSKTTTMDDIFHHITAPMPTLNSTVSEESTKKDPSRLDKNSDQEYEEGDVTGFAMEQPVVTDTIPNFLGGFVPQDSYPFQTPDEINNHHSTAISKAVAADFSLNSGYNFYSPHFPTDYPIYEHHHSENSNKDSTESTTIKHKGFFGTLLGKIKHKGQQLLGEDHDTNQHDQKDSSKDMMSIKDVFDIALTTLAFLSFGLFILQVLMCVTLPINTNGNMMSADIPMDVEPADGVEGARRTKRFVLSPNIEQLNKVSQKILLSIDAVINADNDQGNCLNRVICENNKFSREQENEQRIWMPVWNLGLSWLSSRMITSQKPTASILRSLKASALGLGKADCKLIFQCEDIKIANGG